MATGPVRTPEVPGVPDTTITVGDTIEHPLIRGYRMTVLATDECEVDATRPMPHQCFEVVDPEANGDWLCGYDVRLIHRASQ